MLHRDGFCRQISRICTMASFTPGKTRLCDAAASRAEPIQALPVPGKRTLTDDLAPAQAHGGSSGMGLPPATRRHMEAAFSADFSDVRVHQGGEAAAVGARAYAQGSDVHFASGEYRPGTPEGDRLIGHELTHVLQQRDGRVPGTSRSRPAPMKTLLDP